ncbi:hypothetical protein SAMN06298216_4269 [Spirosomataceae bacterium TFI 002]|nr:hypothetical protein SAMN06298216_4269 [Spirosomataceae bacterium TFI 002]
MKKTIYTILLLTTPLLIHAQGISMGGGTASGSNSFGYGTNTTANGVASIAGGINSVAADSASIAIGDGARSLAKYGTAIGQNTYVDATGGVALGAFCFVQSEHSMALGLNNFIRPNSFYSSAIGAGNTIDAYGATALGIDNTAGGAFSSAMGTKNTAHSYGEVVLGTLASDAGYTGYNRNAWKVDDRLLVLGNGYIDGSNQQNRSNALVILKSGDASFQGGITIGSLETAIDANEDTKLVVYGGTILSESEELAEQVLIGTNVRNNEAKVFIKNAGYPHAMKIQGRRSSSGVAVVIEGNSQLDGNTKINGNLDVDGRAVNLNANTTITGDLTITGSVAKGSGTFKIDHPLDPQNKYLYHSFVESPDMMNVYNGNATTDDNGNVTVTLPEYFEALNMDYRYQLTPIGQFAQAIISEKVLHNQFKIKTDKPNVEVSWQVTGIRNDAFAKQNRVKVSVDKPASEKGTYMHAAAFESVENETLNNTNHAKK